MSAVSRPSVRGGRRRSHQGGPPSPAPRSGRAARPRARALGRSTALAAARGGHERRARAGRARPASARPRCSSTRPTRAERHARAAGARRRVRGATCRSPACSSCCARRSARSTGIPAPQAAALGGALALRPGGGAATASRSAPRRSACSPRWPRTARSLVLVDDAHWLDRASRRGARLRGPAADRRPGRGRPGRARRRAVAARPAPVCRALRARRASSARRRRAAGAARARRSPRTRRRACTAATGGNPLALLELAAEARDASRRRRAAPVPAAGAPAGGVPAAGRRAARAERAACCCSLAAGDRSATWRVLARGRARLGLDVAALDAAEEAGLVARRATAASSSATRSCARRSTRGRRRRSAAPAHARARRARCPTATSTGAPGTSPRRRSARTRRRVARRSTRRRRARAARGAHAVAAAGFERAAGLAPGAADRRGCSAQAAEAAWLGGLAERALELLDAARGGAGADRRRCAARIERTCAAHVCSAAGRCARATPLAGHAPPRRWRRADPERAGAGAGRGGRRAASTPATPRRCSPRPRGRAALASGADAREAHVLRRGSPTAWRWSSRATATAGPMRSARRCAVAERRDAVLRDDPRSLPGGDRRRCSCARPAPAASVIDAGRRRSARPRAALGVPADLLFHVARDHATTDRLAGGRRRLRRGDPARPRGRPAARSSPPASPGSPGSRRARAARTPCRAHADEAPALCERVRHSACFEAWAMRRSASSSSAAATRRQRSASTASASAPARPPRARATPTCRPRRSWSRRTCSSAGPTTRRRAGAAFDARGRGEGPAVVARPGRRAAAACSRPTRPRRPLRARRWRCTRRRPTCSRAARTQLAYGARLRRARRRADAREHAAGGAGDVRARSAPRRGPTGPRAELRATGETARRRDAGDARPT